MRVIECFAQNGTEVSPETARDIARAEMARRRRKLGHLTPEQEKSIETLLISTANKVSALVAAFEFRA